jgi:hypothetical protein
VRDEVAARIDDGGVHRTAEGLGFRFSVLARPDGAAIASLAARAAVSA